MNDPARCPICTGLLYDSSDEQSASQSCLMCGRAWFHDPPLLLPPIPPARPCGRPRKEIPV